MDSAGVAVSGAGRVRCVRKAGACGVLPCPGFAACGEADAWWCEGDAAVAVERAGGLFEGFFADAEAFANEFGRGLVVEVEFAACCGEGFDDAVGERADPAVA